MYYALIMAGGSGTRLWPLSRQANPKQTLRLVGERSLFQHAVDRLEPLFPYERILVGTRREYAGLLQQQVPELPVLTISWNLKARNCPGYWAGRFISTSGIRKR